MKGNLNISLFVLFVLLVNGPLHAEIYQWKDAQGRTHYGDALPENDVKDATKHDEVVAPLVIQGSKADSARDRKQADSWYKKRLKQSRKEDKQKVRDDKASARANKSRRKKCARYTKYLNDSKARLKANKKAGVKPRIENKMRIRIEQYERDVDYYC
ncbi:MAG: DUF4124 domain-containing protein [Gammaproteobacteria bacterium]|nr:DUF4124 domain-containing protein [Gammaproteobacteria bacterium]